MSERLRRHLFEEYLPEKYGYYPKMKTDYSLQIDDQDDNDRLCDFCNIWVTIGNRNNFTIELIGNIPITKEIEDLVDIYDGYCDNLNNTIKLKINCNQIEALNDLAAHIKSTSEMGSLVNNDQWHKISFRTISSLYRFIRIIKKYKSHPDYILDES